MIKGVIMTMIKDLHPKYLTDENGKKISVVIPVEEFESFLEDIEDLKIALERKDESVTSHDKLLKELEADGTI
jgi:PHD/YefM family antitoxin component YafN of YafNO toxin-antitoxin module